MKEPIVSIVVTCFNYSQYIIECLDSISNQTFTDFECIIVNDGSKDNSESVIKNFIYNDERFKYVYQIHSGVSKARNHGISKSSGRYILPVDADDKISSNYVEECFKEIESDKEITLVYGDAYLLNNPRKRWNLESFNFEDLLYKNMIHCTGLFKRDDWKKIGGYDEDMTMGLEDWEFWIHLLKNKGKVRRINQVKFYYRIKNNSLNTKVIANKYGYDSRLYIFNKHIELYRRTNFYDMYFDNYKLKKKVQNPLSYLTFTNLLRLLFESVLLKFRLLNKKVKRKFGKLLLLQNFR